MGGVGSSRAAGALTSSLENRVIAFRVLVATMYRESLGTET